jgi:hypothetical protein
LSFYIIFDRYVAGGSILIPIIIAGSNYKLLGKPLKVFFYFNIFTFLLNSLNIVLSSLSIQDLYLIHLYAVFEFAFISWFYALQFKGRIVKVIPPLVVVFTIWCILNFFYVQTFGLLNTYTRSVESIIIIGYCLTFINKQGQIDASHKWGDSSVNWINAGILTFYSCNFFIFIFSNYLLRANSPIIRSIWTGYDVILLLENILFAIAFYKCKKQLIISPY